MILTEQPMGPGFFIFFQLYDKRPAGGIGGGAGRRITIAAEEHFPDDEKDIMEVLLAWLSIH